jgi:hypothetical protein
MKDRLRAAAATAGGGHSGSAESMSPEDEAAEEEALAELERLHQSLALNPATAELDLAATAVSAPAIVRRDGTLAADTFNATASELYVPFSVPSEVQSDPHAAALAARWGGHAVSWSPLSSPAPHASGSQRQEAGKEPNAALLSASSRVMVASTALELPVLGGPVRTGFPDAGQLIQAHPERRVRKRDSRDARDATDAARHAGGLALPDKTAAGQRVWADFLTRRLSVGVTPGAVAPLLWFPSELLLSAAATSQGERSDAASPLQTLGLHISIAPAVSSAANATVSVVQVMGYTGDARFLRDLSVSGSSVAGGLMAPGLFVPLDMGATACSKIAGEGTGSGSLPGAERSMLRRLCGSPSQTHAARRLLFGEHRPTLAPLSTADDSLASMGASAPTVRRAVSGTGLHRRLDYSVDASFALAPAASKSAAEDDAAASATGAAGAAPLCELAFLQRLEATTYFDLDESRDQTRRGGADLRAFAKFIDVERPTASSAQHVVVFRLPVHSARADAAEGTDIDSNEFGGADAVVNVVGGRERSVRLRARLHQLIHMRYQAVGCAPASRYLEDVAALAAYEATKAEAGAAGGAKSGRSKREKKAAAASVSRTSLDGASARTYSEDDDLLVSPWRALHAPLYGPLSPDGSVYITAKEGDGFLGKGFNATVDPETRAQWPWVSGCYALAHVPLPTLHIACGIPSAAQRIAFPDLAALADAVNDASGALDPTIANAKAQKAWIPVGMPGSSLPSGPGYHADLTPPLHPVPVGDRDDFKLVSLVTALTAMGSALFLILLSCFSSEGKKVSQWKFSTRAALPHGASASVRGNKFD